MLRKERKWNHIKCSLKTTNTEKRMEAEIGMNKNNE
jgi:hypothetical protein